MYFPKSPSRVLIVRHGPNKTLKKKKYMRIPGCEYIYRQWALTSIRKPSILFAANANMHYLLRTFFVCSGYLGAGPWLTAALVESNQQQQSGSVVRLGGHFNERASLPQSPAVRGIRAADEAVGVLYMNRIAPSVSELYISNADGSGERLLLGNQSSFDQHPLFSPVPNYLRFSIPHHRYGSLTQ